MSETQNRFREEVRSWLEANCPPSMRSPYASEKDLCWGGRDFTFQSDEQRLWLKRMSERGWTAPTWPEVYGGGGLDREQAKILKQEMARISARPALYSFGISMLGPALLRFGSDEQKMKYLPPIVRGEIRWCQGYSEPNAGSDLANLQSRLEDRGDHFVLNGSKIWTSYGDQADWMFCLVRTSQEGPRQAGISFVLFDMATPGVTTRPIRLISGSSPFCEVFFDDVPVPRDQLVGGINEGWTIAKYLLTHEREMISWAGLTQAGARRLGEIARERIGIREDRLAGDGLRDRIAGWEMDERAFALTVERARDRARAGESLGAVSSWFKYYGTELNKRRNELLMDLHGLAGLDWSPEDDDRDKVARDWLRSKGNSIEGGTSEIQLNIVAKHVLGLPDA